MNRREVRRLSKNPARRLLGLTNTGGPVYATGGVVVGVLISRLTGAVYVLLQGAGRGGHWNREIRERFEHWACVIGGPAVDDSDRQSWLNVSANGEGRLKEIELETQEYVRRGGKLG